MSRSIKNAYGFTTEFIFNPTKDKVLKTLEKYSQKQFNKDDQLLICFSMHGQYEENSIGALVPKNGKLEDFAFDTWIAHPLLSTFIDRIPCKHITVALDACYSGTFGDNKGKPNRAAYDSEDCASQRKKPINIKAFYVLPLGGRAYTGGFGIYRKIPDRSLCQTC